MSRSNNSRRGSKRRAYQKEFWSKRADGKYTGWSGKYAKQKSARTERQINKPKPEDLE